MIARWIDRVIAYDGSQLRAHWILQCTGIAGDALVAFRGPCRVADAEMADLEDLGGPGIAGDDMVHFLWESFDDAALTEAIWRQRLLTCIAAESLLATGAGHASTGGRGPDQPTARPVVVRDGDDLFVGSGKLSISIATRSPVSTLIHLAVNVSPSGAPVPVASLAELGVEPEAFAREVLDRTAREVESVRRARAKVRAKGEA